MLHSKRSRSLLTLQTCPHCSCPVHLLSSSLSLFFLFFFFGLRIKKNHLTFIFIFYIFFLHNILALAQKLTSIWLIPQQILLKATILQVNLKVFRPLFHIFLLKHVRDRDSVVIFPPFPGRNIKSSSFVKKKKKKAYQTNRLAQLLRNIFPPISAVSKSFSWQDDVPLH